jgi:flagellar protein FlaG
MMNSINATTPASGADAREPGAAQDPPTATAKPAAGETSDAKQASDLRLTIEQDKHTGVYVYRLVDAVTGALLNEIPREQVQAMSGQPSYTAGDLVQAKA